MLFHVLSGLFLWWPVKRASGVVCPYVREIANNWSKAVAKLQLKVSSFAATSLN